ncbi:MAG TPA: aminotransferase class V-fold PLP-dependent enzyme, partial [Vicinamibacterales bacterium]|nr:aminotransferase class V-fold PLP-dependent enzyme [Vicinamibacterales bacterium]
MNRREFLVGAGSLAIAAKPLFAAAQTSSRSAIFPASVRADFPSVLKETYLNSASMHPVGTFAAEAIKKVVDYRLLGAGNGADFNARAQEDLKAKFGAMINAKATEIAYTANTTDGENIVVMGLELAKQKGSNIVIDELHFT